jgi:carboxylesterase type B
VVEIAMLRLASFPVLLSLSMLLTPACPAAAMEVKHDIPYADPAGERQVLDIYTPDDAQQKKLPVVIWIHGGGWQTGDKSDVGQKPQLFVDRGFVFVSTNS